KKYNRLFGLRVTGLTAEVEDLFHRYSWPGNVRELENTIERAFNVIEGSVIDIEHLPAHIASLLERETTCGEKQYTLENGPSLTLGEGQTLADIVNQTEKLVILQALKNSKGNKAKAAKSLGISRPGLYKKLVKYNLA
ncbi:MAG: hypothetical protein MJA84_04275, partial [Firmicutes bacterium]|nr:hypothetical protein [Bacillota bacterium]